MKYTGVEEQIEHGLDSIDQKRTVEVGLRDLIYVFETLQELNRFFRQPVHYIEAADIETYLGNLQDGGAFRAIRNCIYEKMREMIPPDIDEIYSDGDVFDHPDPPYYYQKRAEQDADDQTPPAAID